MPSAGAAVTGREPNPARPRPGCPRAPCARVPRPMPRAVVITAPGGPEVLSVADRDVRAAGPGEVRIAVRAAAVNPTDIGLRALGGGDGLEPPWIPGMDAAGVVESVGEGVDRISPGDEVMAA